MTLNAIAVLVNIAAGAISLVAGNTFMAIGHLAFAGLFLYIAR